MLSQEQMAELSQDTFDPEVMGGSIRRKIVNPMLIEERAKCNFDRTEAYHTLYQQEQREEYEVYCQLVKKHPQLATVPNFYEQTREEKMKEWWARFRIILSDPEFRHLITGNSHKKSKTFNWYFLFAGTNPMTLHMQMFTKSVLQLGSEQQARHYGPLIDSWQIIGCYAQTELGHGSNVAGLETTATLDLETDEFVIHTPTIKAAKFWPGNLGVQATHAVVFARCISLETDFGVQPFIVPIRDLETHEPLPGIEVGDIGTKLGYNTIDNGYLKFNQFRVPRKALLSRFMSITKTGEFKMKANPRIIYQIMVQTRIAITAGCYLNIHRASKIAIRYAACRRQFATIKGQDIERKLLDYQLHMDTLFPILSNGIVLQLVMRDVTSLEAASQKEVSNGSFKLLDILHHLTSGMKALGTEMCYHGVDALRQACGGAGFLSSSGIADLWAEQGPFPTFEGVNVIMYQQSSRMLLKQATRVKNGKDPNDFFAYLGDTERLLSSPSGATTVAEFLDPEHIQRALATRAAFIVKKVHSMIAESTEPSKTKQNELFATDVNIMVKTHLIYIMYERAMKNIKNQNIKDANLVKIYHSIFACFALKQMLLDTTNLYESGFFGRGSSSLLEAAYKQTLLDIRPQALAIAELVPESDSPSTIGNAFGDIYENQFETAKASRLNTGEVPELYHTHIKPVMRIGAKL